MKLPDTERLRIDRKKLTDYLLSVTHPVGAGKARFFSKFGYNVHTLTEFQDALRRHVEQNNVHEVVESEYGTRYGVRCCIPVLRGTDPCINTVWILEKDGLGPQLVTACPERRRER